MKHGIAVNSRNWQSIPKGLVEFMKLHRHYKMDIYFFSQGDDIDMTIKRLAQRWYKLIRYRIPFIYKRYSIAVPVIPSLVISDGGEWKIKYTPVRIPFQRKWLPIYKTWHLFNSYETPSLPIKKWEKWGEIYVPEKFSFKTWFKRFRRILAIKLYRFLNKRIGKDYDNIFKE